MFKRYKADRVITPAMLIGSLKEEVDRELARIESAGIPREEIVLKINRYGYGVVPDFKKLIHGEYVDFWSNLWHCFYRSFSDKHCAVIGKSVRIKLPLLISLVGFIVHSEGVHRYQVKGTRLIVREEKVCIESALDAYMLVAEGRAARVLRSKVHILKTLPSRVTIKKSEGNICEVYAT